MQGTNVMLRVPGGDVVLTDYGVGRISNAGVDVALYAGDAAGTMLYLAPELIGGGRANTFASDVCVRETPCFAAYVALYPCPVSLAATPTASSSGASSLGAATPS